MTYTTAPQPARQSRSCPLSSAWLTVSNSSSGPCKERGTQPAAVDALNGRATTHSTPWPNTARSTRLASSLVHAARAAWPCGGRARPVLRPPLCTHQVWPPERLADAQQRVGGCPRHHEVLGSLLRPDAVHAAQVGRAVGLQPGCSGRAGTVGAGGVTLRHCWVRDMLQAGRAVRLQGGWPRVRWRCLRQELRRLQPGGQAERRHTPAAASRSGPAHPRSLGRCPRAPANPARAPTHQSQAGRSRGQSGARTAWRTPSGQRPRA